MQRPIGLTAGVLHATLLVSLSTAVLAGPQSDKKHGALVSVHEPHALFSGPRSQSAERMYGDLPLRFEGIEDHLAEPAKFFSRIGSYKLVLAPAEVQLVVRTPTVSDNESSGAVRIRLVHANPTAEMSGLDQLPGRTNFLIGNNPRRWRRDVPAFAKVRYKDVYPGIDLVFYGNHRHLEHDFVVRPGARPEKVELDCKGARRLAISSNGDLVIDTGAGEFRLKKPLVYQHVQSEKHLVAGRYALRGRRRVGFEIGGYDKSRSLVIDPILVYATQLGGSLTDEGRGIAVDSYGNAYIVGTTRSPDFPTANAFENSLRNTMSTIFIAKLNASGTDLVYSTYLGGTGVNQANSIALDALGQAYITGFTESTDFPTTPRAFQTAFGGGQRDAFITKLNASGNGLVYSTYVGGSSTDVASAIAVDSSGATYITGTTYSSNFPTTPQAVQTAPGDTKTGFVQDAFVSKLSADGTALIYSTIWAATMLIRETGSQWTRRAMRKYASC